MTNRVRRGLFGRLLRLEDRIAPVSQLLPDLHVLSANLSGWTINTNSSTGARELRFSTAIANQGLGPFELNGTPQYIFNADGTQSQVVNQKIYMDDGSSMSRVAGTFTYHPGHGHVHFDDMAIARLRTRNGTEVGGVIRVGPKTSFCLLDLNRYNPALPGSPTSAKYVVCGSQTQGISVGWADIYGSNLEGQSIDITGVPNGDYWLEVEFDPMDHILEVNETNNLTRIPITITTQPAYGFRILDSNPVGASNDPVSFVNVTFNQAVDVSTFTPASVKFTGPTGSTIIPVSSITTTDSITFKVNFAEQKAIGFYYMEISPTVTSASGKLLDQNNNGTGGEAGDIYSNTFTIAPPAVIASSPSGGVTGPVGSVRLTFSKPVVSSSFTAADILSFTGPTGSLLGSVTGVVPLTTAGGLSSVFDITFTPVSAQGLYSLKLGTDIVDPIGHTIDQNSDGVTTSADQYSMSFSITPVGTAGPDSFGYSAEQVAAQSASIAGKSGVFVIHTNADDATAPVNFGSNKFNYFGTTYTGNAALYVSTNGLVTFTAGNPAYANDNLAGSSLPTLAALWDDWDVAAVPPMVIGRFEDTNGDAVFDRLIIEWNQVRHNDILSTGSGVTFQTILELNTGARPGNIFFNYIDLNAGSSAYDNGQSATVGWRGGSSGPATVISQNALNPLVAEGKAIRISVPQVQSITRADANPNSAGDVHFMVTFSQPVTGVEESSFAVTTTGSVTGAMVHHVHTTANPAVFEVHVKGYTGSGTLRLDLIDTDTIQTTLGAKLGGAGSGNGNFTAGEVYTIIQPPPTLQGAVVGDGTAQRSRVNEVQVIFDRFVSFATTPAAAFTLTRGGSPVAFTAEINPAATQTIVFIRPAGGGSFADGRYTLTALSSQISTGGVALDGDNNGSAGGDATIGFHRLFGDVDGDATTSASDFLAFRLAFLSNSVAFDFDGNGAVDAADFIQFRLRFLQTV
jgi:hypothetical protein